MNRLMTRDPAAEQVVVNKIYKVEFVINPFAWVATDIEPHWVWDYVPFAQDSHQHLPDEPGLYAFVMQVPFEGVTPHGWVLYLGETGDGLSAHTLKKRFKDYWREREGNKRLDIHVMLNAWDTDLRFYYLALPSEKHRLKQIETRLLDTFKPPFTKQGYSAQAQSPQNAF